jgi:pimeloyl-ACP methyl ester carboxylesterase
VKHISTLIVSLIALSATVVRAQSSNAPVTLATSHEDARTLEAPAPTGSYAVGRMFMVWTDSSRRDPVDTTRPRELPVWIWYPAAHAPTTEREPALPPAWEARRIETLTPKLGPAVARAAGPLKVHARIAAPWQASASRRPVLLFTPGLGWLASDYSVLLEDLASHGYVVVGLASPGFADVVRFADGREVVRTLGIGEKIGTDQAIVHADAAFVLRRLRTLADDPHNLLHDRIDLERIGVFGHSLGGTTALMLAARDSTVHAAVNIDGDPMGDVVGIAPRQPLLLISSESPTIAEAPPGIPADRLELMRQGLERSEQRRTNDWLHNSASARRAYRVRVLGTHHLNFEDAALASAWLTTPKERWMRVGPIDGARGLAVTAEVVRAFFDVQFGRDDERSFDALTRRLPEIRLENGRE